MNGRGGFTIIEVLIATVILGVLVGALVGPLGGLFRMTQDNQKLLDNTTLAQQVVERVVREWQDPDKFSRSCFDTSTPFPAGVSIKIYDLTDKADVASSPYSPRSCSGTADSVLLKRIKVTANVSGRKPAVITLDIARPQP